MVCADSTSTLVSLNPNCHCDSFGQLLSPDVFVAGELHVRKLPQSYNPYAIATTPSNILIATCAETHFLFALWSDSGRCERVAGHGRLPATDMSDGPALTASFRQPQAVVVVPNERSAYVADAGNNAIRRVTLSEALVHQTESFLLLLLIERVYSTVSTAMSSLCPLSCCSLF